MRALTGLKRFAALLFLLTVLPFVAVSCGGSDDDSSPSATQASLNVSGDVTTQTNLTLAQIQALPAVTQTVSFTYAMNGAPLTSTGFARLVIPNDGKAGRYVSNLVAIEVVSAPR